MSEIKILKQEDITKLEHEIKNAEEKLQELYISIGENYAQICITKEDYSNNADIREVKKIKDWISESLQVIEDFYSVRRCKCCGNEVDEKFLFCGFCGAKMDEVELKVENQPKARFCKKCGTKVREEDIFCTECGIRFE